METITLLLKGWSSGDQAAAERVLPLVYEELHRIAAMQLRGERVSHTLQATAIVHEAYLRLSGRPGMEWPSREQFFAFAAHLIRRVLVDYARTRNRAKREGGYQKVTLVEAADVVEEKSPELVALDEALSVLEKVDSRNNTCASPRSGTRPATRCRSWWTPSSRPIPTRPRASGSPPGRSWTRVRTASPGSCPPSPTSRRRCSTRSARPTSASAGSARRSATRATSTLLFEAGKLKEAEARQHRCLEV